MKKLNKKGLKGTGGEYVQQQQAAEQQAAEQQQAEQQAAQQQQQQDPVIQLATSFSEMVNQGNDPKDVIMQFIEYEVPEELIYNTLLKVGYEEEDIQALFTQISSEAQQASNEQQAMFQPQQQQQQQQMAKTGGDLPKAIYGNKPTVDVDEGYIRPLPNYAQREADWQSYMQMLWPSYNNRTTLLGKAGNIAGKVGNLLQRKHKLSKEDRKNMTREEKQAWRKKERRLAKMKGRT